MKIRKLLLLPCALGILASCGGTNNPEIDKDSRDDFSIAELDKFFEMPKSLSILDKDIGEFVYQLSSFRANSSYIKSSKYIDGFSADIRSTRSDLSFPSLLSVGQTNTSTCETKYYDDNVFTSIYKDTIKRETLGEASIVDFNSRHAMTKFISEKDGNYQGSEIIDSSPNIEAFGSVAYMKSLTPEVPEEQKELIVTFLKNEFAHDLKDQADGHYQHINDPENYDYFQLLRAPVEYEYFVTPKNDVYVYSLQTCEGHPYRSYVGEDRPTIINSVDYRIDVTKITAKTIGSQKIWVRDYEATSWKEYIRCGDDLVEFKSPKCVVSEYNIIEYGYDSLGNYGEVKIDDVVDYASPFNIGISCYSRDKDKEGSADYYYKRPMSSYFFYSKILDNEGNGVYDQTPLARKLKMIKDDEYLYYGIFGIPSYYGYVDSETGEELFATDDFSFVLSTVKEGETDPVVIDTYGYGDFDTETYCRNLLSKEPNHDAAIEAIGATPIVVTAAHKMENAAVKRAMPFFAYLHFDNSGKLFNTSYIYPYENAVEH